jgi:hypothetical protein
MVNKLWEFFLKTHHNDYYWWNWGKNKRLSYFYWLRGRVLYFFYGRAGDLNSMLKQETRKRKDLQRELDILKKVIRMQGGNSNDFTDYISAYVGQPDESINVTPVESAFFEMSDEAFKKLTPEVTSV